jgi:hypothetical protein
MKSTPDMKND